MYRSSIIRSNDTTFVIAITGHEDNDVYSGTSVHFILSESGIIYLVDQGKEYPVTDGEKIKNKNITTNNFQNFSQKIKEHANDRDDWGNIIPITLDVLEN